MKKDSRKFYSYLDNFDELTIIIPIKNYRDNNTYKLHGNDEIIDLKILEKVNLGSEIKLICSFDAYIELRKIYHVVNEELEESELYTGKIVRTELFDNIYRYRRNDLGFTYTATQTKFKIWTPVAKRVILELTYPDEKISHLHMLYTNSGVWRLVVTGDLEGCKYRYHVYVNGIEQIVIDPYAISSGVNGDFSYVIDKSKLYPMQHSSSFSGNPLEAIIYELNIRDFSMDESVPFKNRGKFLGMTETGLKTKAGHPAGLDYLKHLGITHVQLMPFYDFGGVDEVQEHKLYNWGYNPEQYFIPEGWYSSNPKDPYCRLNELRQMIDSFHEHNISVVMDVVYNHVYDAQLFPMEKLVPGYAYHVDREGIYTNVSGCHNDLATHRKMIRKLIIDSVLYWASEFHIDGFRFDLMGIIDFETMNDVRQELHALGERFLVYGEGWKMYSGNQADRMAHMQNKNVLYTIGFFNDAFRESIKGKTFETKAMGYATGDLTQVNIVKEMMLGSALNRYLFKYTTQSINYVECHDNLTFFDKAYAISKDIDLVKKQQKLATSMVILAQGVPFIHSGQEFFRTKENDENSFKSGDHINQIDWKLMESNYETVEYIRQLIKIRKKYPCFRLKSSSELNQYAEVFVLQTKSLMLHYNDECNLIIIFKPSMDEEMIVIPEGYNLLLSSGVKMIRSEDNTFSISDIGTWIFVKESE